MEKFLYGAFDRQRFQNNRHLARLIADTESRYGNTVSDDDLEQVSAAGEAGPFLPKGKKKRGDSNV